jgi:hypothetical protein
MTKCPKEENTNYNVLNQEDSPICSLITLYNMVRSATGLPIDFEKFILCLDANDNNTEKKEKYYGTPAWVRLKRNDPLLYTIFVKYLNFLYFNRKDIALPINYNYLCSDSDKQVFFQTPTFIEKIIETYNNNASNDFCNECSFLGDFSIFSLSNKSTAENLCKLLCVSDGFAEYTLGIPHYFWLKSLALTNKAYDPNNLPLYDYDNPYNSSPIPETTDFKSCNFTDFAIVPDTSSVTQMIIFARETKLSSTIISAEDHELEVGDKIWINAGSNPNPLEVFPFPAFEAVKIDGGFAATVSEKLTPKSFKIKPLEGEYSYIDNKKDIIFLASDPEKYTNIVYSFRKFENHAVTLIDCEYFDNGDYYVFTIINSWSLNESYKTKFKISRKKYLRGYFSNVSTSNYYYSLKLDNIKMFSLATTEQTNSLSVKEQLEINRLNGSKLGASPVKGENWNRYAPREDLSDPCGYCKYLCSLILVGRYTPPKATTEDITKTYVNPNCLNLGYDFLSYNPMRPHKCECVCGSGRKYNEEKEECVDRVGVWCIRKQCTDGKFYITGCKTGTFLEWISDERSNKAASNFIEDGTCDGSEIENLFNDINCIIETLPEDCDEDPYQDIYED